MLEMLHFLKQNYEESKNIFQKLYIRFSVKRIIRRYNKRTVNTVDSVLHFINLVDMSNYTYIKNDKFKSIIYRDNHKISQAYIEYKINSRDVVTVKTMLVTNDINICFSSLGLEDTCYRIHDVIPNTNEVTKSANNIINTMISIYLKDYLKIVFHI